MTDGDGHLVQELLEGTYKDVARVFNRTPRKNPETKQTEQVEEMFLTDLICALSKDKSGGHSVSGGVGSTVSSYTLFCSPTANIAAGNRLEITTLAGQTFSLFAGQPFCYLSHMEVPLTAKERS